MSDAEAVRKSVRTYMMIGAALLVFTGITVAANLLHLSVPAAITLALIIASIKASMVAARVHAPEPREAVDLRLADSHGRLLHRADVRAVVHRSTDTFGTHLTGPAAGHGAAAADEHAGH